MPSIRLFVAALCALVAAAPPGNGAAQEPRSPYVDELNREIKALAAEEVAGLLAGDGLGFAKAAELNGVPGPRHVLELDSALGLGTAQRALVQAAYDRMHAEAVELGARIVRLETELDSAFAEGRPERREVDRLAVEIGDLRGRLRATHLVAHLETAAALNPEQIERYGHLRGYDRQPAHDEMHGHEAEGPR